ncbi:ATP-grasp domain-containing protein [Candidatus Poriferisodalis sp.]|uniref:ATP-grasp domain-containing protein n=1 Tax=Candidatus Poriferisodalis sp. TaxID=3101277 RepID=UPI003B02A778
MTHRCALLVGDESDFHLRAVAEQLRPRSVQPLIFDADSLRQVGFSYSSDGLTIGGTEVTSGSRGWLRRVAPSRWTTGDLVGSVADVSLRARVSLIASFSRFKGCEWMTRVDALLAAEDRLHQLAMARSIGIATPKTVVSDDPDEIRRSLGSDAVLKPLATGAFVDESGQPQVVHTAELTEEILTSGDFATAPFVAQERVEAERHLRVVTAGSEVRTAAIDAADWPLDWRMAEGAHSAWRRHDSLDVESQALRLADALGVGFSSQDWLVPENGPAVFIDLNPAGQWMFLPDDVAGPITDHIVGFLSGDL